MRLRNRVGPRSAFTLIELLVVIVIIIILMGMLMAAVQKVFVYLDETKTSSEIDRMTQGADAFRTSLGSHPPSRIILIEQPDNTVFYDPSIALHMYSVDTLRRLFPGIYITIGQPSGSNPPHTHDWNGDTTPTAGEFMNMEGDEAFCYFMNGVPTIDANGVIGGQGFCTDKTNPTLPTPGRNRIGPFYEFKTDRLVRVPRLEQSPNNPNNTRTRQVIVYRDIWNTPYAYFQSRYSTQNSYPCMILPIPVPNDCPTLTGVMAPYWHTQTGNFRKFHRADSFQIISAGRDATFFQPIPTYTGRFDPSNPEQYLTMAERDNFTNFHTGALAPR